jgi:hypothetical protein
LLRFFAFGTRFRGKTENRDHKYKVQLTLSH